ncbi:CCA tRNA nucleotidyltransferase [Candidatus Uhrbacteria bacterium]|nr:CCA tRNA nucleotidyltransferase [Candidatus Uhrbacteria bacterium]
MKFSRQNRTLKLRLQRCHSRLVEAIVKIAETVAQHPTNPFGRPPRAFLVGGLVRDLALGHYSGLDADMEVYGVQAEILEAMFRPLFPEATFSTVGKSFGILKISLEDGLSLDLALPRTESKEGDGHRGFRIIGDPNLDPETAARRRDFTINSISLDPLTGTLIDPLHGLFDLEEGILRVADKNTFGDDPLRVLRAVQLVGRFNLRVENDTFDIIQRMVTSPDFRTLSIERTTDEWKKLFTKALFPSRGLQFASDIGLTDFPVVMTTDICVQLAQKEKLSNEERLISMLALLLVSHTPEELSTLFQRYLFGSSVEQGVLGVLHGLRAVQVLQDNPNALRQFLRDLLPVRISTFFVTALANGTLSHARAHTWRKLIKEHNLQYQAENTLLRGQDLIDLGLPAGSQIGLWIVYIETLRDAGKISTREQALQIVTELIKVCPTPPPNTQNESTQEKY